MYFYNLIKKSDFQYREQLIQLSKLINLINFKIYRRESCIQVPYLKIYLNLIRKLIKLGLIKNFLLQKNKIFIFLAYDYLGNSVIKSIRLESSLSYIKSLKKFDVYFLKLNKKRYLYLNQINIFFFKESFYTDLEIQNLKNNIRPKNFNRLIIFNLCKVYF